MIRREIPCRRPGFTIVVGWDNPMSTFFAQVTRIQDAEDDSDPVVLRLGGFSGEVARAEDLAEPLRPFAGLTAEHMAPLRADRAAQADRGPTELQRTMLDRLGKQP